jgi:glycine dehydrogenase
MSGHFSFARRHIGPSPEQAAAMLAALGCDDMEAFIARVIPAGIRQTSTLNLPPALGEEAALDALRSIFSLNRVARSFIGLGWHDTFTPPVIQRNLLENPGWYTAYTPYQAEISQGRLEALLNYQTLITDLTGLDVANASLLDEGTACAEALGIALAQKTAAENVIVSSLCHPHVLEVIHTRMSSLGITVRVEEPAVCEPGADTAAILVASPDTLGALHDLEPLAEKARAAGALLIVTTDLLSLTLVKPPGECGADICVGNSQRFGVPLGFGGPHAAFMAVREALKRRLPGRLIGVSKDSAGRPAFRLSLQTREQHIRREKATSNICTAQVLLAVIASMYAVWHGPEGLRAIALRVHRAAAWLADLLRRQDIPLAGSAFFDTVTARMPGRARAVVSAALERGINLRLIDEDHVSVALDERVTAAELETIAFAFDVSGEPPDLDSIPAETGAATALPEPLKRRSPFLAHPVFHQHHTETAMMRYLRKLQQKDIALDRSMIPLGSCTMKLNAAAEMMPLSWPEVNRLHPMAPPDQSEGYRQMFAQLESWLAECTGFHSVSLQPNAGSQGEYAGLLAIRRFHESRGDTGRDICLIPTSAHGTNPASAVMAGFKVASVRCDDEGNIDIHDLAAKLGEHDGRVAAIMVTYPSTHGVFEEGIREICDTAHQHGAQVYMDGANLNAQLGLTSPGLIGADVCHLNLHKTFCIPHGGGGPGVGPIGVAAHLAPFLPGHHTWPDRPGGAVTSAPWGSASILTISWMYLAMMGPGLVDATRLAILGANYIAHRLSPYFPVLYRGRHGLVAHECILDLRHFKHTTVEDVAKRLMDFGFHAPTMSWPVAGTLMVEPTESESLAELDRFCEAMIAIHGEIVQVESGAVPPDQSPLKHAPHPAEDLLADDWSRPYTRAQAAFPLPWVSDAKYWPPVSRIDNVFGDRHLFCTCPSP